MKLKLTIKEGKGVLGKDKRPFAPRTIHMTRGEWMSPLPYNLDALLSCLTDPEVREVQVICESNAQFTIKIER